MDGSTVDHSDSDSGESWTLLEHSPAYGDGAPELAENNPTQEHIISEVNIEKDEDTDGISVISDSEPESSTPCELNYNKCFSEESRPTELSNPQFISLNPLAPNNNNHHESIRSEDDFLGENTVKHKTYVHRRNKRLSTVLNIIMLGSVITAAGVAIGHMWGARNECSMHTTPSINKILSNLYKLQEENAYLRNKLKELTLASNIQMQQRKLNTEKIPFKQQRCRKIYEEPLNSKTTEKITKCIDNENYNAGKSANSHITQPEYEKEFISDIDKLKNIYQQNKSWLDEEIAKRMKNEEQTFKKMVYHMKKPLTSIIEEQKLLQDENTKEQSDLNGQLNKLPSEARADHIQLELNANDINEVPPPKKITYADSLKSAHTVQKRHTNENAEIEKNYRDHIFKRKVKKDNDATYDILSEEELKKDDRYAGPKMKQDKKKRDRQKLHKKQKRRNKYEQWEMKGGYLKDYDEFSITSSQENEYILKKPDQNILSRDFEKKNYINQFSDGNDSQNNSKNDSEKSKESSKTEKTGRKNIKNEDLNWYDKRAVLRTEARKRLEHELFGETSPNNAVWYFRRMQRREQCRAKGDNSTYKKLAKRNMNFKMKH